MTEAQKELVDNYGVLQQAEADFSALQGDAAAAARVEQLIDAIGPVNIESGKAIADARAAYDALTPREREVFVLAAKGLSNKEAAEVLGIGAETVKMHKANAYAKLGVQSSLEAYQWLENLPTPQPKDVP